MRRLVAGVVAAAGAAGVMALHGDAAASSDRQTRVIPLPAERSLSLEVTNGDVRIQGEPRPDAHLEFARTVPAPAELTRVPIAVEESGTAVRVTAVQAENGTNPAYRTNVTLRVPQDAHLSSIRILEGRLTLAGLRGRITADVRRGPIEAEDLQGTVRLETGMGNIVARGVRLLPAGLIRLRAFNGDVRLTLAARPPDARIMALALNGTITSTIPLRMRDTWGPRYGETSLGRGEPVVSVDVVTGNIEIKAPS